MWNLAVCIDSRDAIPFVTAQCHITEVSSAAVSASKRQIQLREMMHGVKFRRPDSVICPPTVKCLPMLGTCIPVPCEHRPHPYGTQMSRTPVLSILAYNLRDLYSFARRTASHSYAMREVHPIHGVHKTIHHSDSLGASSPKRLIARIEQQQYRA